MTASQIYEPRVESRSTRHRIRGIDYHVREWGDPAQPLVVMLHGWGDCSASFQFTVDAMSSNWHVIAPDWRGFGLSHFRTDTYWFPDYVADLHALLSIYTPDAPANLLGHSMGANAAGLYAGVFPERVRAFINVEGFGLADSDPAAAPENYRRWIERAAAVPAYRSYPDFDALAERVLARSPSMGRERALFVARHWAEQADDGSIVLRADPSHKLPNAVLYRRAEAEACWDKATAAVLLVAGADTDFKASIMDWLDPDESRHPFHGAPSHVIDGAGHMVHFEQPGELAAATEAFLASA